MNREAVAGDDLIRVTTGPGLPEQATDTDRRLAACNRLK